MCATNSEESKRTSLKTEIKMNKINRLNKGGARFTITNDNIIGKQGVILEDQDEYDYISEDDSDSSEGTVSSAESKDKVSSSHSDEEIPPILNLKIKAASQALPLGSRINGVDNEYIANKMKELNQNSSNKMPGIRPANMLTPLPRNDTQNSQGK